MTSEHADIIIVGGGPAGATLAISLAPLTACGISITLIQGQSADFDPAEDRRLLALNYGSRTFLERNHLWQGLPAAPIQTVHVSQQHRLGRTLIRHSDLGVPELGCVVPYATLHNHLQHRLRELQANGQLQLLNGLQVTKSSNHFGKAQVKLSDGRRLTAGFAAITAGTQSGADIRRDYGQTAIIASVRPRLPMPGWAWERFTREGPLAFLPHPLHRNGLSIVWCVARDHADRLVNGTAEAFSDELGAAIGQRLGRLTLLDKPVAIDLKLSAISQPQRGRLIYLGNAAQTLHPVAGQGLNLGLRDVAVLSQILLENPALRQGQPDWDALLRHYARQRQWDRGITRRLTDFMPRIFATGLPPVEHALGLGLLSFSLIPPASRPLGRHLLHGLRN